MKIAMIIPGSGGGFYCENCLRDAGVVKSLRARGHEVVLLPLYLPISPDDTDVLTETPVFFGGIRIYLQQRSRLFRRLPAWITRILDSRWLLRLAARRAGSTRAAGLGAMTLSMLHGQHGAQASEIDRLVAWLKQEEKPDLIHLSSSLLIGLARSLKSELGVPVVCVMQDEDTWLDALTPPYNTACWETLRSKATDVDRFLPVSRAYAIRMQEKLGLAAARMTVVYPGIDPAAFSSAERDPEPPVLGYLSRMSRSLGLETLVGTFAELKQQRFPSLRLHIMGGQTTDDRSFIAATRARLSTLSLSQDVTWETGLARPDRARFLAGLSVLSVPMPEGEAFGLFLLEALAAGVPVVQPDRGGFRELLEATGGGLLYDPAEPGAFFRALERILSDRKAAIAMGRRGQAAVRETFSFDRMTDRLLEVYTPLVAQAQR